MCKDTEHNFVHVVTAASKRSFFGRRNDGQIAWTYCSKCGKIGPEFSINAVLPGK